MTPAWVTDVMPLYERYGEGVPLWLVLGWISVESGGRFAENTTTAFAQGERGYFQLSPGESRDLGFDHATINADPDISFRAGMALVRQNIERAMAYGFYGDDSYRMAKLIHGIGIGSVSVMLNLWPRGDTFAEFDDWARKHDQELSQAIYQRYGSYHSPIRWLDNAAKVERVGRMLSGDTSGAYAQGGGSDTLGLVVLAAIGIAVFS